MKWLIRLRCVVIGAVNVVVNVVIVNGIVGNGCLVVGRVGIGDGIVIASIIDTVVSSAINRYCVIDNYIISIISSVIT